VQRISLDLPRLRRLDSHALEQLYNIVARSWGRRLTGEEVRRIYREGIGLSFTGGGLYQAPELSYALFSEGMSRALPLRWTIRCISGNGVAHSAIMRRDEPARLIVAGSVTRGVFAGLSSTWIVHECSSPGRYTLGSFVNEAILRHYRIGRSAALAQAL
jgi:hypothetical protein